MSRNQLIRPCFSSDLEQILNCGEGSRIDYWTTCFEKVEAGERIIFGAWAGEKLCGYVQFNRKPKYQSFRSVGIPEIQDLFVAPLSRRQGVGESLVKICEDQAQKEGFDMIGIGVGLLPSFGAAQKLYTRLGYIPDGQGIVYDRMQVPFGQMVMADDHLCLMMTKNLLKS